MKNKNQPLCHISDIPEDGCKSFSVMKNEKPHDIFLLKRNNKIFAYKNHCPHTGVNLNWQPDVFMDYDNLYIQCATHGARFEVETGLCVWGPCINQSLMTVELEITKEMIYLK